MGSGRASDLTAVALAAALDAEVCEIYTDVGGRVYSAEPRIVPKARKLGACLLRRDARDGCHRAGRVPPRCGQFEFSRANHNVQIHVRSSFTWAPGHLGHEEGTRQLTSHGAGKFFRASRNDASEAQGSPIEQVTRTVRGVAATMVPRALADRGVKPST